MNKQYCHRSLVIEFYSLGAYGPINLLNRATDYTTTCLFSKKEMSMQKWRLSYSSDTRALDHDRAASIDHNGVEVGYCIADSSAHGWGVCYTAYVPNGCLVDQGFGEFGVENI